MLKNSGLKEISYNRHLWHKMKPKMKPKMKALIVKNYRINLIEYSQKRINNL